MTVHDGLTLGIWLWCVVMGPVILYQLGKIRTRLERR